MKKNKIFLIILLSAALVAASFFIFRADDKVVTENPVEPAKKICVVYVSGQVKKNAVVRLEDNGDLRLIDAVNAVGGVTELADTDAVNLAEPLIDGQHVRIPTKEILLREISATTSSDLININTADEKELQKIKGIGPALAGRIIDYRQSNGAFKSIDEIKKVRGIGDKTFEKMKNQITV